MSLKTYSKVVVTIAKRECCLAFRRRVDYANPLMFFIIVVTLFPLASTSDNRILLMMGPGVIWVAALLSCLLSLHKLFQDDHHDGSLEQLLLGSYPLPLLIFIRTLVYCLVQGLPLMIIAPVLTLLYHLSVRGAEMLIVTLLLGVPLLYFIGSIGAALTVGLRNSGLLLLLIAIPFYIPTLIFSSSAVSSAIQGGSVAGQLLLLAALLILAMTLAPLAAAFSLRIGVGYDA